MHTANAIVYAMLLTGFLLSLTAIIELGVHLISSRHVRARKIVSWLALLILLSSSVIILVFASSLFTALLLLLTLYRAFNLLRIIKGRMHERYLQRVTYRTSLALILLQAVEMSIWVVYAHFHVTSYSLLAGILTLQAIAAFVLYKNVLRHSQRMRAVSLLEAVHDKDLPSLTIAIPARNETEQLYECITSLLASHYPKLEILVLDDCSQSPRTHEIIKGFAHAGVRFIKGSEPSDTWLAKNQAYDTLAKAASGEWLFFAGVDIRLDVSSLRQLVGYALAKQKDMICVMPHNVLYHDQWPLVQPMRYLWELALPRRTFDKPPVLSSSWLVRREALVKAGGFEAASRMVVPEAYFAKKMLEHDSYAFLASGTTLGVTSVKDVLEQRETAIRVSYPQTHRRPEAVALLTLGYIAWIAAPLTLIITIALDGRYDILLVAALVIMLLCGLLYKTILQLAYGKAHLMHIFSFPLAVLVYVVLFNYSMYKYEFSEVIWKGRNVCLPVMHVVPRLPHA
ncbi:MAG: glycosyltransferase family 2 protein [Candidatus Saccharibacteria bacterium]|nr:glycosyltransferase family 2 protein [Candidatus Saccharibacteria bacterium]